MRRAILLQPDRRAVNCYIVLASKNLARNAARRQWQEIVIPILDALDFRKMPARVRLRDDLRTGRMQPFVAVGMVEVPVRIDEMGDRIGAEGIKRLTHLRARHADPGIDEHLAIGSCEDGNVAAGAFEDPDIVSQLVSDDGRYRGTVLD